MYFKHKEGLIKSGKKRPVLSALLLFVSLSTMAAGMYILLLVMTPNIPVFYPVQQIDAKSLSQPAGDMVYIPKIGVSVPLVTGGAEALEKGAWHRFPERGDPTIGGNFIVSAHRFSMGLTPGQTRQKSPFYHIDKLVIGDQILVDFQGKRYGYEVEKSYEVKPDQVEIEQKSDTARLTLYTCTLKGESDGREVFVAKPLGEVTEDGLVARP